MRVAVVGGGISGLGAAYELAKAGVKVVLYEDNQHYTKTVNVDGIDFELDLQLMLFNRVSYPNLTALLDELSIDVEPSNLSFSVSLEEGQGFEWGTRNGFRSLFAQKSNVLKSNFRGMLHEMKKFKDDAIAFLEGLENNPDLDRTETLRDFVTARNFSELFQRAYLVPMCASIWSCSSDRVMDFSAFSVLSFCLKNYLLQVSGYLKWFTMRGTSKHYANKLIEELEVRGCQIRRSKVHSISTNDRGCMLVSSDGSEHIYDECILAVPPPDVINILGKEASHDELRILGALQYINRDVFLHRDKKFMPQNPTAWSAWNFTGATDVKMCLTYWLNVLQNISETSLPLLLTPDPVHLPENILLKYSTRHLVPSVAATKALLELHSIQGKRGLWFCGVYHGSGFHEDGLKTGLVTTNAILKRSFTPLPYPKQMVPTWKEAAARHFMIRYLKHFISVGCLIFLEEGGSMLMFEGSDKRCTWKCAVRVHNPRFYWKLAVEADLGFADAFVNGDISMVDKNEGLLNFFWIILANQYIYPKKTTDNNKSLNFRGWWTPMFLTAGIASAKYFWQHFLRQNTVTQARQNIARHYDMSNDMFSFFLDETMTYSCAIFKSKDEDLKVAQLRKLHLLIGKARVQKHHHVLEIGCGWGSLAIELVKKTGCRYTGITLSEEQVKLAEKKVKAAGLEDKIRFLLCDYRTLPTSFKYDRIISCGMLEHVGDKYYEDFFRHCDSYLAENGILVVQTISVPDERFDEHKRCSDFLREYIFPGGCLPSLSRLTSAMAAASTLSVEHVETIGPHYYQTLRCWRKNFLENRSNIQSLGFDDKFMRVWEYYFDYSASAFNTRITGNYQMVFTRQANIVAFSDPYAATPSTHSCP